MIAACPKCTARYRVDESRIGKRGAKLKCSRCEALFRVLAPLQPTAASQQAALQVGMPSPSQSAIDETTLDRDRLVIVADPNVDAGKATVNQLSLWGLTPILVHDGVEAMLTIQRMLPRAVVLDAALPKMYGFQVCEVIKRNESLRHTGVVLVSAIYNRERYRRQPSELYGADHYIERPDLPDGLGPLFTRMGIELRQSQPSATPAPPPDPAPTATSAPVVEPPAPRAPATIEPPVPTPPSEPAFEALAPTPEFEVSASETKVQPAPEVAPKAPTPDPDDSMMEERSNAERLARIIVSDIALYQPDKFAEAIRQGNPVEAMDVEITEGRALFAQRIDEGVRAERDFIVDELLRVVKERGKS